MSSVLPGDLSNYAVVMSVNLANFTSDEQLRLLRFVEAGGGYLAMVGPSEQPLPTFLGVQPGNTGPEVELRAVFTNPTHPIATRLPDSFYLNSHYHALEVIAEDVETILQVDWRYQRSPVVVTRFVGGGQVACTTLQAYDNPNCQKLIYRLLRHLARQPNSGPALGVGLLGYSPSVGQLHGLGAQAVTGLKLQAVCDLNRQRLAQAEHEFPGLRTYQSITDLGDDPNIDLVIISTPPNTHAELATQMLQVGKHVVCEKPLALSQAETNTMLAAANKYGRLLSCHQNRRWDADYLAIKQAIADGLIGHPFYLETFVGGYDHPCGYWHSHVPIAGGTTFDWGAHYIDWILSLIPDEPKTVIGTRQNRVWHDVTNADQERIQLRFAGGQEAEFLHSDIAAIPKPKWYLLGTEGAIVGHWRNITVNQIDPVFHFQPHQIPQTEMPPNLILQRRNPRGQIVQQQLALPERELFPFHHNLADHLLTGEPLTVPIRESAQVVTILEAATRSAAKNGAIEVLDDRVG
jgi:predicted dehydrogenase